MLPIGPGWTVIHLAVKFPGLTVLAIAGTLYATAERPLEIPVTDISVPESGPMIALTFDDGFRSVYDVALPAMAERGMVGTIYIPTGIIGASNHPPEYMRPEHVKEFSQAGWEVGSHSLYHQDLATLSAAEVEVNMIEPYETLIEWTGGDIRSFSSPLGSYDETVIRFAEVTYANHVNAWSSANGINTLDNFNLFDIHRIDTANTDVDGVCETVASLKDDEFYSIIFHRIDDSGGDYSLTPSHFGAILDCVEASDVQVVTVSDGAESMLRRLGE